MPTVIWNNLHLTVPQEWEMLVFSRDFASGSCTFADPTCYRMQVSWQRLEAEPEIDKMITEFRRTLKQQSDTRSVTRKRVGSWMGLSYLQNEMAVSRFARYFGEAGTLLEVVFPPSPGLDPVDPGTILQGIEAIPRAEDAPAKWKAFGLEATIPAGLQLQSCRAEPASVRMIWQPSKPRYGALRVVIQRLGMVRHWLRSGVDQWLDAQIPDNTVVEETSRQSIRTHTLYFLSGHLRPEGFDKWRRQRIGYRASAWLCPVDGRLYSMAVSGSDSRLQRIDSNHLNLSCCPSVKGGWHGQN